MESSNRGGNRGICMLMDRQDLEENPGFRRGVVIEKEDRVKDLTNTAVDANRFEVDNHKVSELTGEVNPMNKMSIWNSN